MLSAGAILQNRYQVTGLLGQGGFSAVYRAADLRLAGRVVAVKENLVATREAVAAFQNEALLLARLQHDNLPRVTDHFLDPSGAQYLVMDYIEGENLEDAVERGGPLTEPDALDVIRQVNSAVAYLHSQRVVHRDIKPANLIRRAGDQRIMLVDFGIAKLETHGGSTLTGARAATPGYAPPEQYFGHTDARSDVYALGATLYYLLTGRVPPEATARAAGIAAYVAPRQVNPAVAPQVSRAVTQALELDTTKRLQSVERFGAALEAPPVARVSGTPAWLGGRNLVLAAAALLAVLVLAVLIGGLAARAPQAAGQPPTAARATVPPAAYATAARAATIPALAPDTPEPPPIPTLAAVAPTAPSEPPPTDAPLATQAPPPTDAPLPTQAPSPTDAPPPTQAPLPTIAPLPTEALAAAPTIAAPADCDPGETFSAVWLPRRVRLGCPKGSVGLRTFTMQDFIGGRMLWSKATDSIYVLRRSAGWTVGKNAWQSGDPLFGCVEAERAGAPRMGFGKVWCESTEVRATLGAALGLEQADEQAWLQFFDGGTIFEGFGGRVFVLYDDGRWEEAVASG